jgi:hypothetical protein
MAIRKYPRIEIDQRAYDALQAEGILQHKTAKEIATAAILSYVSKESINFIDHQTIRPTKDTLPDDIVTVGPEDITTLGPQDKITEVECTVVNAEDAPQKKKRLADDSNAIAKIKEMWQAGVHSAAKIAKNIGYSRATVSENIKKMKEKGELV